MFIFYYTLYFFVFQDSLETEKPASQIKLLFNVSFDIDMWQWCIFLKLCLRESMVTTISY